MSDNNEQIDPRPQKNNMDLGSVQIHKKVILEIVSSTINDMPGVKLSAGKMILKAFVFFGSEIYPGIKIKLDRNQNVIIDLKVLIEQGFNVSDVAKQIQASVKKALDKTVDINIKNINVNIVGIERGQT